jgi:hypothetical protein
VPGQFAGEDAAARAHLVHQVIGLDAGDRDQAPDRLRVGKEVLAERPARAGVLSSG